MKGKTEWPIRFAIIVVRFWRKLQCRFLGHLGEDKLGDQVDANHTSDTLKKAKEAWYFCSRCEERTRPLNHAEMSALNSAIKVKNNKKRRLR
jgi:hypothetical protein